MKRVPWAGEKSATWNAPVLSKRGKHAEAITAIDAVAAKLPEGSAQREALLAKAESLAGLSKFDDAEKLAREVIKSAEVGRGFRRAVTWNTLGDCLREANKPKEALLAYLHTDLLFGDDKEQHARRPPRSSAFSADSSKTIAPTKSTRGSSKIFRRVRGS